MSAPRANARARDADVVDDRRRVRRRRRRGEPARADRGRRDRAQRFEVEVDRRGAVALDESARERARGDEEDVRSQRARGRDLRARGRVPLRERGSRSDGVGSARGVEWRKRWRRGRREGGREGGRDGGRRGCRDAEGEAATRGSDQIGIAPARRPSGGPRPRLALSPPSPPRPRRLRRARRCPPRGGRRSRPCCLRARGSGRRIWRTRR